MKIQKYFSFMLVIAQSLTAMYDPFQSPAFIINLKIQAHRAANEIRDNVADIKKTEEELRKWIINFVQQNPTVPPEILKELKHEFRQTIVDSKILTWYPWIRNEAISDQIDLNRGVPLDRLVQNFRHYFRIPQDQAYEQIVQYYKEQLAAQKKSRVPLAKSQRAHYGTVEEERELFQLQQEEEEQVDKILRIEEEKRAYVDEFIALNVAMMQELPSEIAKKSLLNEIAADFADMDKEVLQRLMQNAELILERKLKKKFSDLVAPDSPRKIPRKVMISPRETVVEIPDEGRQRPTPQRESHYRPLTRPLPKN